MLSEQAFELIDIVAQDGSFTAAAHRLDKVPSAVSYAVKQIEQELGVTLFNRHHRSVSLTDAGQHFVKTARVLLTDIGQLKRNTQRVANGWQPSLTIAFDQVVRADKISKLIRSFYQAFTDVELIIRFEVYNGVWESLVTGHSDLAIGTTTTIPVGGHFQYRAIGKIEWSFLVGKNHPLNTIDRTLTEDDLWRYPAISLEDTAVSMPKRPSWLIEKQRRLVVPDWIRAINCLAEGLGIGFMPRHLAKPFIDNGILLEKSIDYHPNLNQCCLAWNTEKNSQAIHWVLDYLGDTQQLNNDWLN